MVRSSALLLTLGVAAAGAASASPGHFAFRATSAAPVLSSPNCNSFSDCFTCASSGSWLPGSACRWCPSDKACHAEGSVMNPCSTSQEVTKPSQCTGPTPAPMPPAPAPKPMSSDFAAKAVAELFRLLKIDDVDAATCVSDVGGAATSFKDFGADVAAKQYDAAVQDLGRGVSALSASMAGCGVQEVQQKLDAIAVAIRWANVSTAGLDKAVTVLVGASDLWDDIAALAKAATSGDTTAFAGALNTLLDDWTSITGGCAAGHKECELLDGLLKVLQVVAADVSPCEAALAPAVANFTAGAADFKAKNYKGAVAQIAAGLDVVAEAAAADSCGLKTLATAVAGLGPKLAKAVVTVESSEVIKIIVGSADVYPEIYAAVTDLQKGDLAGFGVQLGALLSQLRASSCATKACILLEGFLASLQLGLADYEACGRDVDAAWGDIENFQRALEAREWAPALSDLGMTFERLASGVGDCGVPQLATILEDTATRLGADSLATAIGKAEQLLVGGADVTLDIAKVAADIKAGAWSAVGTDLGGLSDWVSGTGCKSFVCKVLEGLLTESGIVFSHLEACETDLRSAEASFTAGAAAWSANNPKSALQYFATGLNQVSTSVDDCGLTQEVAYLTQEANVLGFGNITALNGAINILVHGADFYKNLYAAVSDITNHDYRSAGSEMAKVLNQLSTWTKGHACTSDFCYVVIGVMQFMGDMQGDVHACTADFEHAWTNFSAGFENIVDQQHHGIDKLIHWNTDDKKIVAGIHDIGAGMLDLAKGVGDCHLQELADLLAKLAAKLGIAPEISWIEEILNILINGVHIETEIGNACEAFSQKNWVGFGYNAAMLIKQLA